MLAPFRPVLKAKQHYVDSVPIPSKRASGAQQLLEDLIVRRELDIGGNAPILAPESEGVFQRLCGKRGCDTNTCVDRSFRVSSLNAVQERKGYTGKGQVPFSRLVKDIEITDQTRFAFLRFRNQRRKGPQCIRKIDLVDHDLVNRS